MQNDAGTNESFVANDFKEKIMYQIVNNAYVVLITNKIPTINSRRAKATFISHIRIKAFLILHVDLCENKKYMGSSGRSDMP